MNWKVYQSDNTIDIVAEDSMGFYVETIAHMVEKDSARSNARLITAAPDLYMALTDLVKLLTVTNILPDKETHLKLANKAILKVAGYE